MERGRVQGSGRSGGGEQDANIYGWGVHENEGGAEEVKRVLCELTESEWTQLIANTALLRAIDANPTVFTKEETLQAHNTEMSLGIAIYQNHEKDMEGVLDFEFRLAQGIVIEVDE